MGWTAEQQREWRARNPEKAREHARRQAERRNADPVAKANYEKAKRDWAKRHPEKMREYARKYVRSPHGAPVVLANTRAYQARKQGARSTSRCPHVRAIYAVAKAWRSAGEDVHVDHVVPVSRGGEHAWHNLTILPAVENLRKGATMKGEM